MNKKYILDACCGPRGMWFDKDHSNVVSVDKHALSIELKYPSGLYKVTIAPNVIADFVNLPFADETFHLVVFDPPHIKQAKRTARITQQYGCLPKHWEPMLRKGFDECLRVLKPMGVLIFKWNEHKIPVKKILTLVSKKPLFGHRSGRRMQTNWMTFMKI
jgi:SAM-dependent methyltransferase